MVRAHAAGQGRPDDRFREAARHRQGAGSARVRTTHSCDLDIAGNDKYLILSVTVGALLHVERSKMVVFVVFFSTTTRLLLSRSLIYNNYCINFN